ncbi:hypothetical protein [Metabacillus sp. 84]|uniref:hypothetical protein n=1 Tax=unclassified Metabacillus TaxID=2675274 RepID=UPI003CE93F27
MNMDRKKIIIDEIRHWKSSKLLPDTYCDFLLALYTEGEQENDAKRRKKTGFYIPIFIMLLMPASLFIYFTEMNSSLQMALFAAFLLGMLPALYFSRKQKLVFYYMGVVFSILLFSSLTGADLLGWPRTPAYAAAVVLNSLMWILFSVRFKLRSFFAAGTAGILMTAASFIL